MSDDIPKMTLRIHLPAAKWCKMGDGLEDGDPKSWAAFFGVPEEAMIPAPETADVMSDDGHAGYNSKGVSYPPYKGSDHPVNSMDIIRRALRNVPPGFNPEWECTYELAPAREASRWWRVRHMIARTIRWVGDKTDGGEYDA